MYTFTLFSAFIATAIAAPFTQQQASTTGEGEVRPSAGNKTTCDTNSISTVAGAQLSTVINDACAAMMPDCAYQDRLPSNIFCTATVDYPIDGPRSSTQYLDSSKDGVQVRFDVIPTSKPRVMWRVEDCYGYFALILEKGVADGGCHTEQGAGTGSIVVGGKGTLARTVFKVTVVG